MNDNTRQTINELLDKDPAFIILGDFDGNYAVFGAINGMTPDGPLGLRQVSMILDAASDMIKKDLDEIDRKAREN